MPADGFDERKVAARRGRRDPEVASEIALNFQPEEDPTEPDPDGLVLLEGDIVTAKVVHTMQIDGQESWFTYGVQTRVMHDEGEEDVFERVSTITNTRVLQLAEHAVDLNEALKEERRRRPITPR